MRFKIYILFFVILIVPFYCFGQSSVKTLDRSVFIGAEIGTLSNPVRVAYKMKVEKGIIIYKVFPNSAADNAGLIEKDVIIAIDSTHLNTLNQFQDFIKTKKGNDTLNLFFVRNDTVRNTSLVLHFLPRETNFYFETMYDQIEINDSSQNNTQISLRTIITIPRTLENEENNNTENTEITQFPLVIILNSASNESIERELYSKNKKKEYQFYDWIENLTKNGFATLRIEKKGIGDSNGKLNEWTFEDEQKSINSALEKIKKYGYLDKENVFLVALGSSSFVGLENVIRNKTDTLSNFKNKFKRIFIEKLPAELHKTKNQNIDSLLTYFPQFSYFDKSYSQTAISNLNKYNLIMDNQKFFWIESKEDVSLVISRLKKETE